MADDSGPSIPNTDNWSEWTFEQVLLALTGEKADLHTPAQATIFNFDSKPSESDWATYHAWGEYFYGVNLNQDAFDAWTRAFTTIDEMMPDVARGKRGSMDLQTLRDMETQIRSFMTWSDTTGEGINTWARNLDSDDSAFEGKAASLIQWRLKANGDGLVDTHEQLTTRHGRPIADAVKDAGDGLSTWSTTMSSAWTSATGLNVLLWNTMVAEINAIAQYIDDSGLQLGTPNYRLNDFGPFVNYGKDFIREQLSHYSKGSLLVASTWDAIGKSINDSVIAQLKSLLDVPAQGAIGALAPKYRLATSALIEITAPPKETPPTPDPNTNNGDTPPPDGSGNIPPPPDGGGNGDIPPPPGGDGGGNGDIPPPPGGDGGGNGDLNIPGGGDGNVPGAGDGNLSGSGDVPPPDGGAGLNDLSVPGGGDPGTGGPPGGPDPAGGSGAFLPFAPPGGAGVNGDGPGGNGSVGPGGDGAFEEPGGGDGVIGGPPEGGAGGDGSQLPHGAGDSRTAVPPGGGFGSDPGKNFDAGGGLGGAGVGAGAGAGGGLGNGLGGGAGGFGGAGDGRDGLGGLNGLGGGLGGASAGLGGGAGLGGSGGLYGGVPSQLSGGSPGMNGASGSSGGEGGVPFFPPMMGGQGAGGEKPQERERQTWLSEDEEIWGTSVGIGSGVIGRLDEEEQELEEVPLTGPSRRRTDGPRRPRRTERAVETDETGEETSSSASAT